MSTVDPTRPTTPELPPTPPSPQPASQPATEGEYLTQQGIAQPGVLRRVGSSLVDLTWKVGSTAASALITVASTTAGIAKDAIIAGGVMARGTPFVQQGLEAAALMMLPAMPQQMLAGAAKATALTVLPQVMPVIAAVAPGIANRAVGGAIALLQGTEESGPQDDSYVLLTHEGTGLTMETVHPLEEPETFELPPNLLSVNKKKEEKELTESRVAEINSIIDEIIDLATKEKKKEI